VAKVSKKTKAPSIEIPHSVGVRELADLLQTSPIDIIKQLMRNGIMANINQVIDYEAAASVATDMGYEAHQKLKAASTIGDIKKYQLRDEELGGLRLRPPVVTIMGHVNHGKTRLLDTIRQTNVMASEAGGITQHIGAYQVEVNGQKITFLDTPGHEAFTAIRARGAQVTDIAILVVAADDGVMPQTLEAIDHARAAGVPIVVAINKIDKPDANPELTKQQLADAGLLIEEWGGDTVCVLISAKEKNGISELLENLLVVAEMAWGRIKAMFNDVGKRLRKAEPSTPVELLGLNSVPQVGDTLTAVAGERQARALIQKRQLETEPSLPKSVRLDNLFNQISAGKVKELNVILKVDVQGSIEPIRSSLEQLGTEQVKLRVIHSGSGNITESDVMLAIASKGLVIGFNVSSEPGARRLADVEDVDIRYYDVIYNLTDDVDKALKGMLEPTYVDVIDGHAEVRAVFPGRGKIKIAGAYVTEGKISRGASVRVRRGEQVVFESTVSSLRRFKDDVKEVVTGYECGVGIDDFNEFQVGDVLEFFRKEKAE